MRKTVINPSWPLFDFWLMLPLMALCLLGLVMVSSASIDFASVKYANPFFHTQRHAIYLLIGAIAFLTAYYLPLKWLQFISPLLLLLSIILLSTILLSA